MGASQRSATRARSKMTSIAYSAGREERLAAVLPVRLLQRPSLPAPEARDQSDISIHWVAPQDAYPHLVRLRNGRERKAPWRSRQLSQLRRWGGSRRLCTLVNSFR